MNIWEKIKKQRLEKLKKASKPVDAIPLIKFMLDGKGKFTKEQKDKFIGSLHSGFEESGKMFLDRAILEKVITEKEAEELKKMFTLSDFGTVLQEYFSKKDGHIKKDTKVKVLTVENTTIFKHRDMIKKRFGVDIISAKEGVEELKKNHPDVVKKIEEKIKTKNA